MIQSHMMEVNIFKRRKIKLAKFKMKTQLDLIMLKAKLIATALKKMLKQ